MIGYWNYRLNINFKQILIIIGISRIEKSPFPEAANREALLNAIAHKDYSEPCPIQISVYLDRILFWNPGELTEKLTIDQLGQKHPSISNNPILPMDYSVVAT